MDVPYFNEIEIGVSVFLLVSFSYIWPRLAIVAGSNILVHFRNFCELKHWVDNKHWLSVLEGMQKKCGDPFHTDVVLKVYLNNKNKSADWRDWLLSLKDLEGRKITYIFVEF